MKKRRLKKPVKRLLVVLLILIGFLLIYNTELGKVNNSDEVITFEVADGSTYNSISSDLKEKKLIKSELFYKLYIKLHKPSNLKKGIYELSSNMGVKQIVNTLEGNVKTNSVTITFKEGITFVDVAQLIEDNIGIEKEKVIEKGNDTEYLNTLIDEYWFLTDEIKNEEIYYPLEGYLFPDTYQIDKDSSIEDIFKLMLDNMDNKLSDYKNALKEKNIHDIITMASIVEKEASNSDDRAGVAGVFYNRLDSGMSLGSDVTTYYGLKLDLTARDLTYDDLNSSNGYNTRNSNMAGKLPVGPICIPVIESIEAAINPTNHNYYYYHYLPPCPSSI